MHLREMFRKLFDWHSGQSVQFLAKMICTILYGTLKIGNPEDCETGFPYRSLQCDDVATMPHMRNPQAAMSNNLHRYCRQRANPT